MARDLIGFSVLIWWTAEFNIWSGAVSALPGQIEFPCNLLGMLVKADLAWFGTIRTLALLGNK